MARFERTVFELRLGPYAGAELDVIRVRGEEALSEPFAFEVDFLPRSGAPIDLEPLLSAEACLTMRRPGGVERFVHGICVRAEQTGAFAREPRYRMVLGPKLLLLGQGLDSRVFLDLSVPQIVKRVLGEGGIAYRDALMESYPPREMCVQYRESDLRFVSRLLAEEGIFTCFEHAEGSHVLVLGDDPSAFAPLAGGDWLPYREATDAALDEGHVRDLRRARRVKPSRSTLRDYDFERPRLEVTGITSSGPGDEVYDYPSGYVQEAETRRLSRLRLEELRFGTDTFHGTSTCERLVPGATFAVEEHPVPDFEARLLLVRVEHSGTQQGSTAGSAGSGEEAGYANRFLAIEASRPYRPPRWRAPLVALPQTATVVGAPGEEIHPDQYGRIKVQFHWDREGKDDDRSSAWVRLAQPWAGGGFGALYVPRVGQEVLVRFLEGNPDRPIVAGAVYNGLNTPPLALPGEKTRTTNRSHSTPQAVGSNELRLEDRTGDEEVYLHAQKDESIEVGNDKAQRVLANETLQVGRDRARTVGGNQDLAVAKDDASSVGMNQTLTVDGDRDVSVEGDHEESIGLVKSVKVQGSRTAKVSAASAEAVGAGALLNIGGGYDVNVLGAMNQLVGGALTREVGGAHVEIVGAERQEKVGGDSSAQVGGDFATDVKGGVAKGVGGDLTEKVGGSTEIEVTQDLAWSAKTLTLEADHLSLVVAGKTVLEMDRSGTIVLAGTSITVDGKEIALKGSNIAKVGPGSTSGSLTVKALQSMRGDSASVELKLEDSKGNPVASEPFTVEFPGGEVRKGATGADGRARVLGPKDGACKVTLTQLEPQAWSGGSAPSVRDAAKPKKHVVRKGECLSSIARRYGIADPMRIYQDPGNATLRKQRPNPNILHPGDVVAIPDVKVKTVVCETGKAHRIIANPLKKRLKIALLDGERKPLEGVAYQLSAGGEELSGTTAGDGVIHAQIDARTTLVTLSLNGGPPETIKIGYLNPLREVDDGGAAGVHARLENLGYDPGPRDGDPTPRMRSALRSFQREHELEPTGEISDDLITKLEREYGC